MTLVLASHLLQRRVSFFMSHATVRRVLFAYPNFELQNAFHCDQEVAAHLHCPSFGSWNLPAAHELQENSLVHVAHDLAHSLQLFPWPSSYRPNLPAGHASHLPLPTSTSMFPNASFSQYIEMEYISEISSVIWIGIFSLCVMFSWIGLKL